MMPGDSHYTKKFSHKQLINLFKNGFYRADISRGKIYRKNGKLVKPYEGNDGYLFVRLYKTPHRITIPVSKLVWILGTNRALPSGFQIHHRNRTVTDNSFNNLLALSELDHRKVHEEDDYVPF